MNKKEKLDNKYSLSYNQKLFWFVFQIAPESAAYNIYTSVKITSSLLNLKVLQRTWQKVINKHSILRTTYINNNEYPLQLIHKYQKIKLQLIDASNWSENELKNKIFRKVKQPFDLERDPLVRIYLFRRTKEEYIQLITTQEICCDLRSLNILLRELLELYNRELGYLRAKNNQISPEKLVVNNSLEETFNLEYLDYMIWQKEILNSSFGKKLQAYWEKKLAMPLTQINLPIEHSRPKESTFQGGLYLSNIEKGIILKLRYFSQAKNTNISAILLTIFCTLIFRLSQQTEITILVPLLSSWCKLDPNKQVIGMMSNAVIFRVDFADNPTFEEALKRVQCELEEVEAYKDYPFLLVNDWLRTNQMYDSSSLFKIAFSSEEINWHQQNSLTDEKPQQLHMKPYLLGEQQGGAFDLYLTALETDQEIQLCWKYSTDLFSNEAVERMAKHFQTLLNGIFNHPQQRLLELPLLTEIEQHQLLLEWNNFQGESAKDKLIHQMFEAQVKRTPDAVAVVFESVKLTYQELNSSANQLAHYLRDLGVKPEVPVGLCIESSPEMIVGLLGILKAGGAYLPLDPAYPQERLTYMLTDSQVPVLLAENKLLEKLTTHQARIVCLDTDWIAVSKFSRDNPINKAETNNLAYIIYTSGSTGNPKGVMIEHQSLVNFILEAIAQYGCNQSTRALQFASISFDTAAEEIYPCLTSGGTLVLKTKEMLASIAIGLWTKRSWFAADTPKLKLRIRNYPSYFSN